MQSPLNMFAMAFVYRRGFVNEVIRGVSVMWTVSDPVEWYRVRYDEWTEVHVLGTNIKSQFRITSASGTDWVILDPDGLRVEEPFIRDSPIEHQMQLGRIQKRFLIDLRPNVATVPLPFLLCTSDLGTPTRHRVLVHLDLLRVDDLPDVSIFVREELADATTALELKAVEHLRVPIGARIPKNSWLPATFVYSRGEIPAVYRIEGYLDGSAIIDLWIPSAVVSVRKGDVLKRVYVSPKGNKEERVIGTVGSPVLATVNAPTAV